MVEKPRLHIGLLIKEGRAGRKAAGRDSRKRKVRSGISCLASEVSRPGAHQRPAFSISPSSRCCQLAPSSCIHGCLLLRNSKCKRGSWRLPSLATGGNALADRAIAVVERAAEIVGR